ncbi:lactate dehydrogenase [Rubidibacter lacunae KORDI 51-2]|uniref:Lactate dehydrogenase n=1 Tax=Rubidibacter lacunae KORDI 51-2 TaxID=582515 RepID=U5DF67_9CHRO|nr:2-hydroxyacid dehydrogenase [Rubidibacter lacunae]ERN43133.1 lactate dehydrogenase [Rubidibacter lacunae KORDI 51-2]
MKVAMFSTKRYDRTFFDAANRDRHEITYFEPRLTASTAPLAERYPAVCAFINDELDAATLKILAAGNTRTIALRSAGFNNVDLPEAKALGMNVVRVPAYSPYAVAEHAVGLVLTLNRKLHRAYSRVRDDNFALDGLLGFDLHGATVGIVGTGKIGRCFACIMQGFGCKLLAYDVYQNPECLEMGIEYVELPELLGRSDIISLHCPLTENTHHLVNDETIALFKPGVMLINTSRGALIDTAAAIQGIKSGQIGYLGIDVYEREADIFFEDLSDEVLHDDVFQLLQSFSNVVITAHQAFFTRNALEAISSTTLANLDDIEQGRSCANEVKS